MTPYAFPQGSVFTRESLRKREQEQLDMLNPYVLSQTKNETIHSLNRETIFI